MRTAKPRWITDIDGVLFPIGATEMGGGGRIAAREAGSIDAAGPLNRPRAPAHDLELEQPLADQGLEGNITAMIPRRFRPRLLERPGN